MTFLRPFAFTIAATILFSAPVLAQNETQSPGEGGAAQAEDATQSPQLSERMNEARDRVAGFIKELNEGSTRSYQELQALVSELRMELNDQAVTERVDDAFYDTLRSLDQAASALREESKASALAALESAEAIMADFGEEMSIVPSDLEAEEGGGSGSSGG